MYDRYVKELNEAKKVNDTEIIFESVIKIGALENIFDALEEWRIANEIYPNMFKGEAK